MTGEPGAFPLFLRLEGRRVLVVGGGSVALEKARGLRAAGAWIHVVAPSVRHELLRVVDAIDERPFDPRDLDDVWLVIAAATSSVNRVVRVAANARRLFVIAVDDVENCTAIGAATLRRGGLTVAISSDGRAPALVALLRRAIERLLPDEVPRWMDVAEESRSAWKAADVPFGERRPLLLRALNALYEEGAT